LRGSGWIAQNEIAKNTYLPIDEEELEALKIDSSQTIDIDSFVPRAQIGLLLPVKHATKEGGLNRED
jgi:non-homologous end joining protein Ku